MIVGEVAHECLDLAPHSLVVPSEFGSENAPDLMHEFSRNLASDRHRRAPQEYVPESDDQFVADKEDNFGACHWR